jgi:hypothetical protein
LPAVLASRMLYVITRTDCSAVAATTEKVDE